jgi:hypothetical protein
MLLSDLSRANSLCKFSKTEHRKSKHVVARILNFYSKKYGKQFATLIKVL